MNFSGRKVTGGRPMDESLLIAEIKPFCCG